MATQPMTKFVVNDPASTEPACLYLKNPSDEQLDAVLAWLHSKQLDMLTCLEGEAIFTKSGKGKSAPAIAIQFQSAVDFDAAAAQMAELYPAPKSLDGVNLTDHAVTDPVSDMPIAPINDPIQASAPGSVSIAEVMEGTPDLTPGDRALAQARQAINVGGPMPSVVPGHTLGIPSADDVPF